MSDVADRTEPFRVIIDAEEMKGLARVENELTRFLRDFPGDAQQIAVLERLKVRADNWAKNDISRFLLLRVDSKLQHLRGRAKHGLDGPVKRAA